MYFINKKENIFWKMTYTVSFLSYTIYSFLLYNEHVVVIIWKKMERKR